MSGNLEQLLQIHATYLTQRNQANNTVQQATSTFQQLCGAMFAIEELIKVEQQKIAESQPKEEPVQDVQEEQKDGEVNDQEAGQAA